MLCLLNCLQLNYPNNLSIKASLLKANNIYLLTVVFLKVDCNKGKK